MSRTLYSALCLWLLAMSPLTAAIAQQDPGHCNYDSASLYDGWGWDPVSGQSCPPQPGSDSAHCDYSAAAQFDGWGWDPVSQTSCPPLTEPAVNSPPNGGSNPPSTLTSEHCSYADAELNGGWGWNPVTRSACPPLTANTQDITASVTAPLCSSDAVDPDGDGYGWENGSSCVVFANNRPTQTGDTDTKPACVSAASDPDGDGFGWENNTSCVIQASLSTALAPQGNSDIGTPRYRWPAVANADRYRIVVADDAGNGFRYELDPFSAGCQTGIGECSASPDLAYYDNDLNWHVESVVDGGAGPSTPVATYRTPVSLDIQPVTSNPSACEAYPSVVYDNFVVINNIWNARSMNRSGWSQTIQVEQSADSPARASWVYDWLNPEDGGIYDVKAYPEVIYGNKLGVHVSGSKAQTGLPEKVSDIDEFTIDFSYTDRGDAERNVALESFFHESCDITGPCDTYDNRAFEMMVWVTNPSVRTPGDLTLTGVMIDNRLWDVYTKPRSNKKYIAFTAHDPITSGTLHWNRFVEWTENWTRNNAEARGIDVLQPHFCMGAIELGTEVWSGQGSFTLDSYRINRQ